MDHKTATNKFSGSSYIRAELKCAVQARRNSRRAPIGGMSTSQTAIDVLRALGFIECARSYAQKHSNPLPMGGWVATVAGCRAAGAYGICCPNCGGQTVSRCQCEDAA
jgi:hypothetical protein